MDRAGRSDQVLVYDLSTKSLVSNEILRDEFENVGPSLAISPNEQKLVMLSPEFNPKSKSWNMSLHVLYLDGSSEPIQYDLPVAPTDLATRPLPAMGLAISPDASLIAVGLSNGALYIVDASTGELARDFPAHQGHAGPIIRLAFNKEGSLLASLERSGIVKIWGIAP
jgi:WD40 repeat protein